MVDKALPDPPAAPPSTQRSNHKTINRRQPTIVNHISPSRPPINRNSPAQSPSEPFHHQTTASNSATAQGQTIPQSVPMERSSGAAYPPTIVHQYREPREAGPVPPVQNLPSSSTPEMSKLPATAPLRSPMLARLKRGLGERQSLSRTWESKVSPFSPTARTSSLPGGEIDG